jgi:glutathione synthase/RimK-type ligase-like ATP-grasp enzyme
MILIISGPGDVHTEVVERRLRERGAEVAVLDLGDLPAVATASAWVDRRSPLRARVSAIDLEKVRSIWFRRPRLPQGDADLDPEDQAFARDEALSLLLGLARVLDDRFWVNPPLAALATDAGRGKLAQLELARRAGLAIPRTLATNDPEAARDFVRSCPGGAIYKPFRTPLRREGETVSAVFTNRLDERSIGKLDQVRHAPCIFQELVEKQLELRVTVIGKKVFACEIHSQAEERSRVDFRRTADPRGTLHRVHELPEAVARSLVALDEALGLVFGAVDMILTPAGEYVFLENNQQGQFLWLEELAGQPLLEPFCEMLIRGAV